MSIEEIPEGSDVAVLSRNEKKARDALLKLGLKPMKDITRVTFRKKGNFILAIDRPEVFKSAGGSYVIFGEAKVEDLNKRYQEAMAAQQAAQQAADSALANGQSKEDLASSITADLQKTSIEDKKTEEDDEEEVDATGLQESDIDVIVEQTSVSRNKAIKALKEHNGDVVNAIMALTS